MVTDNRADALFPDVSEHYGNDYIDDHGNLTLPQRNHVDQLSVDPPPVYDVVLPVVQVTPEPSQVESNDHQLPAGTSAEDATWDDYRGAAAAQIDAEYDAGEGIDADSDPLAHAPDWVRAHIPRHGLVLTDTSGARKLSVRMPRRTPKAQGIDASGDAVVTEPEPPTPAEPLPAPKPAATRRRPLHRPVLAVAAGIALAAGVAAVLVLTPEGGTVTAVPPLSPATATTASASTAPQWCESSSAAGKIVGRGAGDNTTGPGVIQAFDYAYYVEHNGAKVASMMLHPNPVAGIQASIDDAAASHTEHCLTIVATPDPNAFDVALQLRSGSAAIGVVSQHITVGNAGQGLKIATLEEVR